MNFLVGIAYLAFPRWLLEGPAVLHKQWEMSWEEGDARPRPAPTAELGAAEPDLSQESTAVQQLFRHQEQHCSPLLPPLPSQPEQGPRSLSASSSSSFLSLVSLSLSSSGNSGSDSSSDEADNPEPRRSGRAAKQSAKAAEAAAQEKDSISLSSTVLASRSGGFQCCFMRS